MGGAARPKYGLRVSLSLYTKEYPMRFLYWVFDWIGRLLVMAGPRRL